MKKNLTILCDEDSIQYQMERQIQTAKHKRQNTSPFSKNTKEFNIIQKMTSCQTPHSDYPRQSFEFKSPKYSGIIEKNILQRLEFYDQKHKEKRQNHDISMRLREQQLRIQQLRQKPQINGVSKSIYEKIKKQRKLSPNILQRFQTYECQRVSRNAKYELLKTYDMQIKNTIFTCRKNLSPKSRSPLRQTNPYPNRSKQRSKTKSTLKKTIQHSQNIGKIVHRKPKNPQTTQNEQKFATSSRNMPNFESLQSFTPKKKDCFQKKSQAYQEQMYESQISFKLNAQTQATREIFNKNTPLSPILQKKPKGQKWRVIS